MFVRVSRAATLCIAARSLAAWNCYVSAPGLTVCRLGLALALAATSRRGRHPGRGLCHVACLADGFQMTLTITNPQEVFRNWFLDSEKRRLSEVRMLRGERQAGVCRFSI
jgi:hypothetical protein